MPCGITPLPIHPGRDSVMFRHTGCFSSRCLLELTADIAPAPLEPQDSRGKGGNGLASPIGRVQGSPCAAQATEAAIEAISGCRFFSCCKLDHFPKIQKIAMDLLQA